MFDMCLHPGSNLQLAPPCDHRSNALPTELPPLLKSVQSALSDLKRPLNVYSPSAIIGLSLLNSILMARFLKQNFAQTCLKETDNGKLQQFNYSRSLITKRGTVERGIGRIAKNYYAPLGRET